MGAAMVMLTLFFGATLTVAGPAVIEYVRQVTDAIDIPVMVPQVRFAKVEVPQAADKLHGAHRAGSRRPAGAFHPDPLPLP